MPKKIGILLLIILLFPKNAGAVPPPDFIMQVASQVGSFFSIAFVFLLAILSTSYQFVKTRLLALNKKIYWAVGIVTILLVAGVGAYYYDQAYQEKAQKEEYGQWLNKSLENSALQKEVSMPLEVNIPEASPQTQPLDEGRSFIENYYQNLANHEFEKAYAVSKKTVKFEIFSSWYQNVDKIVIRNIEKQDQTHYLVSLTLEEKGIETNYQTLFTLSFEGNRPTQIIDSEVTILPQAPVIAQSSANTNELSSFWDKYKNVDLKITNKDFSSLLKGGGSDYLILDARENIEFENGQLPDSHHIRFADIKEGQWQALPKEKFIYVLCWSGIRGKEVAEYLRGQGLIARYLENGLDGWVKYGGTWNGEISFTKVFPEERYGLTFKTDQVKKLMEEGVKIVDSRAPDRFAKKHIPGSINIPLIYTPTDKIEARFAQLSGGGKVITVCDEYVNCFDARLTGVELERRGYEFLGRYTEPWNF